MTKGNTNNIFKYNNCLYIIRTKILRNIFDSDIEFENIKELINYLYNYPLPNLNYIPISYSLDNKYTPYCYTSMLSLLDSKGIFSLLFFL